MGLDSRPLEGKTLLWYLGGAVIVAAALRLYLLWQYYGIHSDGVYYIAAARDFFAGRFQEGLSSVYPPGYPLLIASAYPFVGDWELAGQIVSLLSAVILMGPLFLLLSRIYGNRVALLACFLVAVSPYLARYSVHVRTEVPYLLLSTIVLLLTYEGIVKFSLSRIFLGGLMAGLAYLVRPEAVGFLIIVFLALTLRWWTKKGGGLGWFCKANLVFVSGFFLLAFFYIVYLRLDAGEWALSRKMGITLWISLRESGLLTEGELRRLSPESLTLVRLLIDYPFVFIKKFLLDFLSFAGIYLEAMHYSYVPFFLVGLFLFFRTRFWEREDLLLFLFLVFYLVGFALIYPNRRYALQMVPISMGWAAIGMMACWNYLQRSFSPHVFRLAAASLGAMFLAGTLPKTLDPISKDKAYIREAGYYLKARRSDRKLTLLVTDIRLAFYADATPIYLNRLDANELPRYLKRGDIDFLVAEDDFWKRRYSTIAENPERHGLVLEKAFTSKTNNSQLLLFQIRR